MPKCRSCKKRVSGSLKWCSFCGVWTPDKTAYHFKIGVVVTTGVLLCVLAYFMVIEMRTNQQKAREYEKQLEIPQ